MLRVLSFLRWPGNTALQQGTHKSQWIIIGKTTPCESSTMDPIGVPLGVLDYLSDRISLSSIQKWTARISRGRFDIESPKLRGHPHLQTWQPYGVTSYFPWAFIDVRKKVENEVNFIAAVLCLAQPIWRVLTPVGDIAHFVRAFRKHTFLGCNNTVVMEPRHVTPKVHQVW